ncbi:MAG: exopolysaccharide biosynthesis polyprenyl glycosylphosphotransferase [Rhodothermales bacterium]|nr:exopolysaccharide biosynthesis polyprenyl glycosylphosphotransferase [Rhodothermales bacterium]
MITKTTYVQSEPPVLERPLESFFEVDDRISSESASLEQGTHQIPAAKTARTGWGLFALDCAVMTGCLVAAVQANPMWQGATAWAGLMAAVWLSGLLIGREYPGWARGPVERLRNRARAFGSAIAVTWAAATLAGQPALEAGFVLLVAGVFALGALVVVRTLVRRQMQRKGAWGVNTVFYGTTESARRIIQIVQTQPEIGFRPIGIFEDDPGMWGKELAGVKVLGDTGLVHPDAPVAVVAGIGGTSALARMDKLLRYYRRVVIVPDLVEQSTSILQPVDFGGLLGLQLKVNLASGWARGLKRSAELLATAITTPLWGGVVAVGALVTWLEDRANPFYQQVRIGRNGEEIRVQKIRTMVPDAEAALARAFEEDPTLKLEWEATSKLQNDPRITRVGRILRRLSIDELPQLWNVLTGDMSLIGPRPLPAYHESRLPRDAQEMRRRVRPGVTGLWQISGRSDTGDEGIAWLDAYYVRNWSIWLDLAVLLRTFRAAVRGEGAY